MKIISLLALVATATLLPACSKTGGTSNGSSAADNAAANSTAAAGPVSLPPAVTKTTSYRCADSSIVTVDFFADSTTASLKVADTTVPVKLTAPAAGQPFVADGGYSLSGDGPSVQIALPGKTAQSCNG